MRLVIRYVVLALSFGMGCRFGFGEEGGNRRGGIGVERIMFGRVGLGMEVERRGIGKGGYGSVHGRVILANQLLYRFCKEYTSMEVNPSSAIT